VPGRRLSFCVTSFRARAGLHSVRDYLPDVGRNAVKTSAGPPLTIVACGKCVCCAALAPRSATIRKAGAREQHRCQRLQQQLYQAFDLQILYDSGKHQVSIHTVITPATPRALAAIITGHA
jgi:hypothetical protein